MLGEDLKKVKSKIVIGDADSLIALAFQDDANYVRAKRISIWLQDNEFEIIYPNTALLEAIVALKRGLGLIKEVHILNGQYLAGKFLIEFVTVELQMRASKRFEKTISKKNTIFDAIVAETAIKLEAYGIFSFDSWYRKEGFHLVSELEE